MTSDRGTNRTKLPRTAYAAIFLLALSVLVVEVALTRIFALITFYHFTYLIIGLALLGFGAAGTVLSVSRRFAGSSIRPDVLASAIWFFALALLISLLTISKVTFDATAIHQHRDFSQLYGLLLLLALAALPFFCGGLAIGYLITKSGEEIHRIYFLDLAGAGCGSLAALFAVNGIGPTSTILWISAAAALLATAIAWRGGGGLKGRYLATAVLAGALGVATAIDDDALPIQFPASKGVDAYRTEHRWHVVARIDVNPPEVAYPTFGGALSRVWDVCHPPLRHRMIYQDGMAPTGIVDLEGSSPAETAILGHYLQGVAYVLRPGGEVLVIGAGGGIDVAIALHHGSAHVTAVDLNPRTIELVRETYREFAGGIYDHPDVSVVCAEGRHFLTANDRHYDVIQLSGVDTFTPLASGAYALSENYLYTVEAIGDLVGHLKPDGVVSFSRWLFTPPRETLRLAVTARKALEARGAREPWRHLVVLAGPAWEGLAPWAETLIKAEPFTEEELEALRGWCAKLRFDVIYDPFRPYEPGGPFDALESTEQYGPALNARVFSEALRAPQAELDAYVERYPYNIRPATDDSPFFFNFYRLASLRRPFTPSIGGYPITRLPLGLLILIASAIEIILLSAALILWPMRTRAAGLGGKPGTGHIFVYFAAIGLAFIGVEIMLVQKLMVFLGGPVYSMAITLASLLIFCGLGSFLARRLMGADPQQRGPRLLAAVALVVLATTAFLNAGLPKMLGLDFPWRCAVAIVTLLPAGLLMGMPFPTGIRLAERLGASLVPWAWCVNACATVMGSVLSILGAMFFGFTPVVYVCTLLYVVALAAMAMAPRAGER